MCRWCAEPGRPATRAGLVERPAQSLVGRSWRGPHGEAAAGAVRTLLEGVQAEAGGSDIFSGPLVSLSWSDGPEGFRTFVGVDAGEAGSALALTGERVDLPGMRFAADWHDAGDGDVLDHYQALIEWVRATGNSWDKAMLHHREEYPRHANFSALLRAAGAAPDAAGGGRRGNDRLEHFLRRTLDRSVSPVARRSASRAAKVVAGSRPSGSTTRAPASGKPGRSAFGKTDRPNSPVVLFRFEEAGTTGGRVHFSPNPSDSASADAPHRPSPKSSTLCQMPSGRAIQCSPEML